MTTFEFRTEKSYIKVWEALNATSIHFASYGYKAITLFDEKGADMVREACTESGIKFKEAQMTNSQRLRSMTDDELSKSQFIPCPYDDYGYGECKYGWHDREQTCEECKLEWLQQDCKH